MAEVRAGVDALDERLVALLAERFRYMDAACIKPERDEAHEAAVIAHARDPTGRSGLDPDVAASPREELVKASITHEPGRWDEDHAH